MQIDPRPTFARRVIAWQQLSGRHHLPWQNTKNAYHIWLSEIMLQQTQVATVIPYYERFLAQFPNFQTLALAQPDAVLAAWAGLGYYSRARNLHQCAKQIVASYQGQFPRDVDAALALPGIGRSTAAAILGFAYGLPLPILDANVKRVFCRYFGVYGDPSSAAVSQSLWAIAQQQVDSELVAERVIKSVSERTADVTKFPIEAYNQGLMDLGATLCTSKRPDCARCPLSENCVALQKDCVEQLPSKKRRIASPTRKPVFLLVVREQSVWLERQPAPGIWAGLYSLPKLADDFLVEDNATQAPIANLIQYWLAQKSWVALNPPMLARRFKHAFTHFKLDAQCWQVAVGSTVQTVAEPGKGFYSEADRNQLGLPKPIQTLLKKPVCFLEID